MLAMSSEPDEADDRCPTHQAHRIRDGNDEGTPGRMAEQVPRQRSGKKRRLGAHQDLIERALATNTMLAISSAACSSGTVSRSALCEIVSSQMGFRAGFHSHLSRASSWNVPAIVLNLPHKFLARASETRGHTPWRRARTGPRTRDARFAEGS